MASKAFALTGGALTLLDYATTVTVSASTASAYIWGEIDIPFPVYVGTIIIVATPLFISLLGLRESARTALCIMMFHVSFLCAGCCEATVQFSYCTTDGNYDCFDFGLFGCVG